MGVRSKIPVGAEYVFDIIKRDGAPDPTLNAWERDFQSLDEIDRALPYYIDNVQEAIQLAKEISEGLGLHFNEEDWDGFRKEFRNKDRLILYVIERVILKG